MENFLSALIIVFSVLTILLVGIIIYDGYKDK
jgi:hypothetical protein